MDECTDRWRDGDLTLLCGPQNYFSIKNYLTNAKENEHFGLVTCSGNSSQKSVM